MAETQRQHVQHPNYGMIAIVLAVITFIEVLIPQVLNLPRGTIVTSLLILMTLKGAGVALYYMHLRFDSRVFSALVGAALVIAAAMIVVFLAVFRPVIMPA